MPLSVTPAVRYDPVHRKDREGHADAQQNNYSTKGNVNPSNGETGTKRATH